MSQAHVQEHLDDAYPRVTESTIQTAKYRTHFHRSAYKDEGVVKIGWGTSNIRGKSIQLSSQCEESEAEKWLIEDLIHAANVVKLNVNASLTQAEFDVLVAIAYKQGELKFVESYHQAKNVIEEINEEPKKDADQGDGAQEQMDSHKDDSRNNEGAEI